MASEEGQHRPELSDKVRGLHSQSSPEVPGTLTCRWVRGCGSTSAQELKFQGGHIRRKAAPSCAGQNPGMREGVEEGGWGGGKVGAGSQATRILFPSFSYPPPTLGYPASLWQVEGGSLEKRGDKTAVQSRIDHIRAPKDMHQKVPSSTIQNSPKLQSVQMSIQ